MGDVYQARDVRLNRTVAIKVSRAHFSDRFEREARAIAALNHPHICALYDIGPDYLVMELVAGATLAERIAEGPLPVAQAVAVARQIGEALDAAHEKGIVHRDLKPANVKLTPDGAVKVLDFGLATGGAEPVTQDPTISPTLTISPTRAGTILGTAAYMAPEQARGAVVDKRADIWAFGVVLYEMLTGKSMFGGDSVSDVLAAVLRADPDWQALPPGTPPSVRRLLRRCLEKDRKKRLRDIADGLADLDAPEEALPKAVEVRRPAWLLWAAAAALAAGVIALAWVIVSRPRAQAPAAVSRWTVTLPEAAVSDVALSRDGTHMVYAGPTAAAEALMVRTMDQHDLRPLPGTAAAVGPVFSPDGRWVAYFEGQKLLKIAFAGGPPVTICQAPNQRGRTWGDDNTIVFGTTDSGLMRVSAAGGQPKTLTTPDRRKGEMAHQWPWFLPGAQAIVFTILTGASTESSQIAVLDLKRGTYRTIVNGGSNARYAPSGHLVFGRGGELLAAPFDARKLEITGPEVPMIRDIGYGVLGTVRFAFSDAGLLVYLGGDQMSPNRTLDWVDSQGHRQPSGLPARLYGDISLSPDGHRVAASVGGWTGPEANIWIGDLDRGMLTRLTSGAYDISPVWSPDGRRVLFGSFTSGKWLLRLAAADGSGTPGVSLEGRTQLTPLSWSANPPLLLYLARDSGLMRISAVPAPADGVAGTSRGLFQEGLGDSQGDAQISRDGRWIAYASNESGRFEIYVRPFPAMSTKLPISTSGGESPRWSASGRQLFYRDAVNNQLMAVDVETAQDFHAGRPRPLFPLYSTGASTNTGLYKGWDVTADGKRFLVINAPGAETGVKLQAVVNWFEELRRRAPADR